MKTLSDFKKRLQVGTKLSTIYHTAFAGRDEQGKPFYKDEDRGTREVSIVQSNSFALKTTQTTGKVVDSWCAYPKAKECVFKDDNTITILETTQDGNTIPVLTYTFIA